MRGQGEEPGGLRLVLGGLQPLADEVRQRDGGRLDLGAVHRRRRRSRCGLVRRAAAPREHPDGDRDDRRETPAAVVSRHCPCILSPRDVTDPGTTRPPHFVRAAPPGSVTDPGPTRPPRTSCEAAAPPGSGAPAPTAAERTRSVTCCYHRSPGSASPAARSGAPRSYWPGARAPPPLPTRSPACPDGDCPDGGCRGGDAPRRRARHADRALALAGAAHRGVRGAGPLRVGLRAVRRRRGGPAGFVAGLGPEWVGLSLTMPLKRVALEVADEVAADTAAIGAANTLVRRAVGLAGGEHRRRRDRGVAAERRGGGGRARGGRSARAAPPRPRWRPCAGSASSRRRCSCATPPGPVRCATPRSGSA